TPSATPTPTVTLTPVCEARVWPNPFNPAYAVGGILKVSCVPPGGTVSFFTLSGELAQKIGQINGMVLWDGRNQRGVLVSSAVYFYVIQQGERVVQRGKLMV